MVSCLTQTGGQSEGKGNMGPSKMCLIICPKNVLIVGPPKLQVDKEGERSWGLIRKEGEGEGEREGGGKRYSFSMTFKRTFFSETKGQCLV